MLKGLEVHESNDMKRDATFNVQFGSMQCNNIFGRNMDDQDQSFKNLKASFTESEQFKSFSTKSSDFRFQES